MSTTVHRLFIEEWRYPGRLRENRDPEESKPNTTSVGSELRAFSESPLSFQKPSLYVFYFSSTLLLFR